MIRETHLRIFVLVILDFGLLLKRKIKHCESYISKYRYQIFHFFQMKIELYIYVHLLMEISHRFQFRLLMSFIVQKE